MDKKIMNWRRWGIFIGLIMVLGFLSSCNQDDLEALISRELDRADAKYEMVKDAKVSELDPELFAHVSERHAALRADVRRHVYRKAYDEARAQFEGFHVLSDEAIKQALRLKKDKALRKEVDRLIVKKDEMPSKDTSASEAKADEAMMAKATEPEMTTEPEGVIAKAAATIGAMVGKESVSGSKELVKSDTVAKADTEAPATESAKTGWRRNGKANGPVEQVDGKTYYTVILGDTLWDISNRFYGTTYKWYVIHRANPEEIVNPRIIEIGQRFLIPNPVNP